MWILRQSRKEGLISGRKDIRLALVMQVPNLLKRLPIGLFRLSRGSKSRWSAKKIEESWGNIPATVGKCFCTYVWSSYRLSFPFGLWKTGSPTMNPLSETDPFAPKPCNSKDLARSQWNKWQSKNWLAKPLSHTHTHPTHTHTHTLDKNDPSWDL